MSNTVGQSFQPALSNQPENKLLTAAPFKSIDENSLTSSECQTSQKYSRRLGVPG